MCSDVSLTAARQMWQQPEVTFTVLPSTPQMSYTRLRISATTSSSSSAMSATLTMSAHACCLRHKCVIAPFHEGSVMSHLLACIFCESSHAFL